MANRLLDWFAPRTDTPGRRRSYHRPLWLVCALLAVWLFAGLPPVYYALAAFIGGALLLAWFPI